MRDVAVIDSELRLLATVRRTWREHGGVMPSTAAADALLDERAARRRRRPGEPRGGQSVREPEPPCTPQAYAQRRRARMAHALAFIDRTGAMPSDLGLDEAALSALVAYWSQHTRN